MFYLPVRLKISKMTSNSIFESQVLLSGTFKDLTGNYNVTFHFLGASLLLASAIILIEPLLRRWEARNKNLTDNEVA